MKYEVPQAYASCSGPWRTTTDSTLLLPWSGASCLEKVRADICKAHFWGWGHV